MIIYTHQKSKKRKPNAKQKQLAQEWQEVISKHAPKKIIKSIPVINDNKPYRRETPYYPSLNSNEYNTFKKNVQHYTGDNMKGIGTLHKSNAVPIFTEEEARDQASMRR
jgi:hypothetical protein